ncbi:conserved protein of unknown function (plasmid) [Magnetospirillum sp. XM-1]|uniref:hypothetical protein n=1 Tax=Magnetospirillum sp. XM-1 TaxID=1663591 RepID=UPI00073DC17C|nr:hypothetical protein [Magnetospirillum sp. XM-1]CUW41930.1 conserved protein of unknown function [Magnetospirillum sp. XM-1]
MGRRKAIFVAMPLVILDAALAMLVPTPLAFLSIALALFILVGLCRLADRYATEDEGQPWHPAAAPSPASREAEGCYEPLGGFALSIGIAAVVGFGAGVAGLPLTGTAGAVLAAFGAVRGIEMLLDR